MNCRRHGRKPTLALWMIVAVVDLTIIATAIGAATLLAVFATLTVLAGAVVAGRLMLSRRAQPALITRRPQPAAETVVRRRA